MHVSKMETNVSVPAHDEYLSRQSAHAEDHPEHHHAVGDATQGGNLMGGSGTTDRVFSNEETRPLQGVHHAFHRGNTSRPRSGP